ncbi:hypothetical protein ACS86_02625 (plasmid) [Vibrio alginolyticus]|uniref:Uncharacterized protein n=2 Tax=Vibrio cyclitrophicus TaxID=47951 RepID=A0A7Z1MDD2_9VIBR|nr:hypothetical protein [Vibrio cyclitrophicus]KOE87539.1 hypothetical protein ACS86_02625 [Vibrio alginolyticus]PMP20322.1 hypothetical protein BCS90_07975 [Vibrio cyclitrophicus]PMP23396.1 hypothetical protein BCS91_01060 [Vibrio cyclitrophicus]HAS6975645.1 hypothetical protein [Vibrio parahaemolyticus]
MDSFVTAKEIIDGSIPELNSKHDKLESTDVWLTDKCQNPEQIMNAIGILRTRIEQKFPNMTGDKQDCLKALNVLDFWCTPLQDKGETSGFNDYLELHIETKFDSVAHQESWKAGFLKAHRIVSLMNPNDKGFREVSEFAETISRR